MRVFRVRSLVWITVIGALTCGGWAQQRLSSGDRHDAQLVLAQVRDDIKNNYYDPTFHGVDLEVRFQQYSAKLQEAPNLSAALRLIEAFTAGLDDSHTFFIPPAREYSAFYGFTMLVTDGHCFVNAVRPGYDAAAKLHPGDEVVSLDGYAVNRGDAAQLLFALHELEPQPSVRLALRDPRGTVRNVQVNAKVVRLQTLQLADNFRRHALEDETAADRQSFFQVGKVMVWRVPSFAALPSLFADGLRRAQGQSAIVMDLRDNPGGDLDTLRSALSYFVTRETTAFDQVGRHGSKPFTVEPRRQPYSGKLVVVINSGSASAAELFARVIQLEKLGTVVGSRSAGAVMVAQHFMHYRGFAPNNRVAPWNFLDSVTIADARMTDGQSLEHVGVTPDVTVEPTAADLAAGRDVVLARAVAVAGGSADPAALRQAFPDYWPADDGAH